MGGRVVIGLSSWGDPGFIREWYPRGMDAADRLRWYAERFEAVELNSSFYALPDRAFTARWAQDTPEGFSFDVKLHRLLSRHAAPLDSLPVDLRDRARTTQRGRVVLEPWLEEQMLERLREELAPLEQAGKLHGFLLQLSPAFSPDAHALSEIETVLRGLEPFLCAVELRHRAWVADERREQTLEAIERLGGAWVSVDAPVGDQVTVMPALDAVTRDGLAYLRLHGRDLDGYLRGRTVAERFGWVYSDQELGEVRQRVARLAEEAGEVRVMFNNNRGDDAPVAARRLRELMGQDPGPPPDRGAAGERRSAADRRDAAGQLRLI